MQLVCNYHDNVPFIDLIKLDTWHYGDLGVQIIIFEILISTIHYDYSFMMALYFDMWHNPKLPCGILIEIWENK
jgi:hypothetical protein